MGYTMENIDINALRSYRIEFEYRNPEHVWNGYDDQTFLKNMGVLLTRITTPQGASVALNRLIDMDLLEKVRKGRQVIYQLKA